MVVYTHNILLVLLTMLLTLISLWALVLFVRVKLRFQHASESLLIASVLLMLMINAEIYALSFIPLERPLEWLGWFHFIIIACLAGYVSRIGGTAVWIDTIRFLYQALNQLVVSLSWDGKMLVALSLTLIGIYFGYGAYSGPSGWDGLEYHVPMAVQPYQDGRIGVVDSALPWADAYPRGVPLIWFWTLQLTGTDVLFQPTQVMFGLQLLLATYVLARRSGVDASMMAMAIGLLVTMPLFFVTTVTTYVDIAYGASVVTLLSFLAPSRDNLPLHHRDWLAASFAFAQSCLIKVPVIAVLVGAIGISYSVLFNGSAKAGLNALRCYICSWRGPATVIIVLLACHKYVSNWVVYGNPIYPIALRVFGIQVFNGLIDNALLGMGAHTTMGKVLEMSYFQRLHAAWADWFNPPNIDSLGSVGPAFLTIVLPGYAMFVGSAVSRVDRWHLALALTFVAGIVIPGTFLPRYSIALIAICTVCAMWVIQRLPFDLQIGLRTVMLIICLATASVGAYSAWKGMQWIVANANGLSVERRGWIVHERVQIGIPGVYLSPQALAFIRDHSLPGDTLVWNVATFHGTLWNRTYSNRVIFLSMTRAERYPGSPAYLPEPSKDEMEAWTAKIKHLQPRHIVVYERSPYARMLSAQPSIGYCVAYRDPPVDYPGNLPGGTVIFERCASGQ